MKDGWSVLVSTPHASGTPKTRHYVVAIEDEAEALAAVKREIAPGEMATISAPVGSALLDLRNMAAGEVRVLGGKQGKNR